MTSPPIVYSSRPEKLVAADERFIVGERVQLSKVGRSAKRCSTGGTRCVPWLERLGGGTVVGFGRRRLEMKVAMDKDGEVVEAAHVFWEPVVQ